MQNAERDLHRWLPCAYNSGLETFSTVIEVFNPDEAQTQQRSIPILLASDVLHAIWKKQSGVLWDACIGATPEKCKLYWDYASDEWASDHPVVQFFNCIQLIVCSIKVSCNLIFPMISVSGALVSWATQSIFRPPRQELHDSTFPAPQILMCGMSTFISGCFFAQPQSKPIFPKNDHGYSDCSPSTRWNGLWMDANFTTTTNFLCGCGLQWWQKPIGLPNMSLLPYLRVLYPQKLFGRKRTRLL